MNFMRILPIAVLTAGTVTSAQAAPVSYEGVLQAGQSGKGAIPTTGFYTDSSQIFSDYWLVAAQAGQSLSITVNREETAFDVAFWLFDGFVFDDTDLGPSLGPDDPGFVYFADDELFNPGPFGDPRSFVQSDVASFYSVIVTNFLSGPDDGDGLFPYTISVDTAGAGSPAPVPLPAGLPILAGALGLLGMFRRRG